MNTKHLIITALCVGSLSIGGILLNTDSVVSTNAELTLAQSLKEAKQCIFGGEYDSQYDSNSDSSLNVIDIINFKRQAIIEAQTSQTTTTTEPTTTTTPEPTTTEPPVQTTTEPPTTTTEPPVTTQHTHDYQLPNSAVLWDVTPMKQTGLPTGCEATGLTILLNWLGFDVTKEAMALTYMPRQDFYYADGKLIGADFINTFAGNPSREKMSYGCYVPCMIKTVENYFDDIGYTDYQITDLTGTSLDDLFYYVYERVPVPSRSTPNLKTPKTGDSWYTSDGRYVTWQQGHHCMILVGYDYSKNIVYASESMYSSIVSYDMDKFRNIYNLKGKYSMIVTTGTKSNSHTGNSSGIDIDPSNDEYVLPFSDGQVCTLKNVGSGKYLNVDYGKDANDTNVYQWTGDGSTEQTFKMNLLEESSCYLIRAMCSSNGENRTLDIVKDNGNIVAGGNVDIYNPTDTIAQQWLFVKVSQDTYKIVPKYNTNLALTVYGNSNGSADGTSTTSAGNVFVDTYKGSNYQLWKVTSVN